MGRGIKRVLGIFQKAEENAKQGQDHLGDDAAQLAVAADRNGLQEVRHHHHGTDIGTIERDQRANVVDPVASASQSLVHELCVRVVRHNLLVVVLSMR